MRFLVVLLALSTCGALVLYLATSGEEVAVEDTELHPSEMIDPEFRGKVALEMDLDTVVVPEEPSDLWGYEPPEEEGFLADRSKMEMMIRWPKEKTKLSGAMMLKAIRTAVGPGKPFRFVGDDTLQSILTMQQEMPPPHQEPIMEIMARLNQVGWRLIERDDGFWFVTVEGRDDAVPESRDEDDVAIAEDR